MKKVVNTQREVEKNPLGFLVSAMAPNPIERQEAQGQRSFVGSDTLPTEGDSCMREVLGASGVQFLGTVDDDPMFQYVKLPAGWKKQPTDHSMWSELVDDKGRKRAAIFYKAAFYDRSAHLNLNRRYNIAYDYDLQSSKRVAVVHVKDGEQIIYSTEPRELPDGHDKNYYVIQDAAKDEAMNWVNAEFPKWQDVAAYWD